MDKYPQYINPWDAIQYNEAVNENVIRHRQSSSSRGGGQEYFSQYPVQYPNPYPFPVGAPVVSTDMNMNSDWNIQGSVESDANEMMEMINGTSHHQPSISPDGSQHGCSAQRESYTSCAPSSLTEWQPGHPILEADVAMKLEIARETTDAHDNGNVMALLHAAFLEIWLKIRQQPYHYVMTRHEFAVFNFFQYIFRRGDHISKMLAREATRRYWDSDNEWPTKGASNALGRSGSDSQSSTMSV
ncbi:hypothetical protein F4819DRAFT_487938 [Hypoxylon fuscum]|nr:hypothetical protein F4819DRAFT_487938 [Hypoxylon fuscum]